MDKQIVVVSKANGDDPVPMCVTEEQYRVLLWLHNGEYLIVDGEREDVVDMTKGE